MVEQDKLTNGRTR